MPTALVQRKANVVVLWTEEDLAHEYLPIIERRITACCGYRRVDANELPLRENEVMVFVRAEEAGSTAAGRREIAAAGP